MTTCAQPGCTSPASGMTLHLVPVSFKDACGFVAMHHRHHLPPVGCKFVVGVADQDGVLHGVMIAGRPVARVFDDGMTIEVTRTATDGTRSANSMLYGAARRAAFALGYRRLITYTQAGESGASLRGAGYRVVAERPPRPGWNMPSRPRDDRGVDGIPRTCGRRRDPSLLDPHVRCPLLRVRLPGGVRVGPCPHPGHRAPAAPVAGVLDRQPGARLSTVPSRPPSEPGQRGRVRPVQGVHREPLSCAVEGGGGMTTNRLWQLPYPMAVRRLAQSLASRAQAGELAENQRAVYLMVQDDPRRAGQLMLALCELAAVSLAPVVPAEDPDVLARLRAAHAAYGRGVRVQWVIDGERDYQREKKRRQRQAKRVKHRVAVRETSASAVLRPESELEAA